jgi:glucan phosphorylase
MINTSEKVFKLVLLLQNMTPEERKNVVTRVCVIGGKAAPGYEIAKKIIKLVTTIGERINNDNDVGNLLKVVRKICYSLFLLLNTQNIVLHHN